MNKLHTGLAGSGKSTRLINEVYSLIEGQNITPAEILILTLTPQENNLLIDLNKNKENSSPLNIQFFETFCTSIISKSLNYVNFKSLDDAQSIILINSISKEEFAQNPNMASLTKSNQFARELHDLFGILKNNNISDFNFFEIVNNSKVNTTDKIRLYLIANVFAKYNKTLQHNQLIDFRDNTITAIELFKKNDNLTKYIKNMYKYIFIDGFQNISILQLELLKLISNNNLYLFGDELARIQEFKGAWQNNLDTQHLNEYINNIEQTVSDVIYRNDNIINRATYLLNCFTGHPTQNTLEKTSNIAYIDLEDLEAEINFIATEIYNLINNEGYNYSDFAIIVRDYELRHKLIDLFKSYNLPIDSELCNESFSNLKTSIIRYFSLCNAFEKLNIEKFSPYELEKASIDSTVDLKNIHEEINLYFENILNTIFNNNYYKHKLLSLFENSNYSSLIASGNRNQEILPEPEKVQFENEIKKINKIYRLYKERKLLEASSLIIKSGCKMIFDSENSEFTGIMMSKIASIMNLYTEVINSDIDYETIIEIINSTVEEIKVKSNAVKLESVFQVIGKEYKFVFIPGLTEKTFPKKHKATQFISPEANTIFSEELRQHFPNFKSLIESDEDSLNDELKLFYLAMTRAKEKLYLSAHQYEDKKQVQHSIFYTLLKENDKDNLLDLTKVDKTTGSTEVKPSIETCGKVDSSDNFVIPDNEELRLSASSISQYLKCPKQYFYKNLIALKEDTSIEANYGTIAHTILEVFNKQYSDDYTKDNLLKLTEVYFNSCNDQEPAIEAGFKKRDVEMLNSAGMLNINIMKENLVEAINIMEERLFFDKPFESIETEKSFEYTLDELENVRFKSRIDAIIKTDNGYNIVDYKTGANKKKDLSYLVSEHGVKFEGDARQYKGVFNENNIKSYEYQIPLYYAALQQDENYKDKINKLGLTYIRPRAKDNGYKEDYIDAGQLERHKEQIINNLLTTVIQPIRETKAFEPDNSSGFMCDYCSYKLLCNAKEEDDDQ